MIKFIIMGGWCEVMAHLHTLAENEAEALQKWEAAFTPAQRRGLDVVVVDCSKRPDMNECWRAGQQYYFGGYEYSSYDY